MSDSRKQWKRLGKSKCDLDKQQARLQELAGQLNEGDMSGSGGNLFAQFDNYWLKFKDPALEASYWHELWTPARAWWKILMAIYTLGVLFLTGSDLTGTNHDVWKTRALGRGLGPIMMGIFLLVSPKMKEHPRRQCMWGISVYWFVVGVVLTDDERLIQGMRKFHASGGVLRDIAEFYGITNVAPRTFCRSMMPFVVAQLSLWATCLRFSFRQATGLILITSFFYCATAVYCELRLWQDQYGIGMEMLVLSWVGITLLWSTRRNETLTRYCFLRHVYELKNKTQAQIRKAAHRKSLEIAAEDVAQFAEGSQGLRRQVVHSQRSSLRQKEAARYRRAVVRRPSVNVSPAVDPRCTGALMVDFEEEDDHSDEEDEPPGSFSCWIRLKDSMLMTHEVLIFISHVDWLKNEFYDKDAERAFREGGWMSVKIWVKRTAWVVFSTHLMASLYDATKVDENGEPIPIFLAVRVGFRMPIFLSMLAYRFTVHRLEDVNKKRKIVYYILQIYFLCITMHNDEIVCAIIDKRNLATVCYGMLPFLTAQMAWMMVALRPPLHHVKWLLFWVGAVYFGSGWFFQVSTWTEGMSATVYEMMCMMAACVTFTLAAARGEMLARIHFMTEYLKLEALNGEFGTELQENAEKEALQEKAERAKINATRRASAAEQNKLNSINLESLKRSSLLVKSEVESLQIEANAMVKIKTTDLNTTTKKKRLSPKEIAAACGFIGLLLGFMLLVQEGYLQAAAEGAADLGPAGHVIFIVLYLFVAQPFGWGYSFVIIAGGYSFGWAGLISAELGTLFGSFSAYLLSRLCISDWVKMKLKGFKPKTQKILFAIELAIKSGKGGLGLQIGLRVNPVLPFGWTNAIMGMWQVKPAAYVCSTMTGCQIDIILKTNLGVMAATVGDLGSSTPEQEALIQKQLIIQCVVFVVVIVSGCVYGRWIMRSILPSDDEMPVNDNDEDEEDQEEAEEEDVTVSEQDVFYLPSKPKIVESSPLGGKAEDWSLTMLEISMSEENGDPKTHSGTLLALSVSAKPTMLETSPSGNPHVDTRTLLSAVDTFIQAGEFPAPNGERCAPQQVAPAIALNGTDFPTLPASGGSPSPPHAREMNGSSIH